MQSGPGSNVSDYSHGTGFINWWGWDPVTADRTYLTDVTAPAKRGATVLTVRSFLVAPFLLNPSLFREGSLCVYICRGGVCVVSCIWHGPMCGAC